MRVLGGAVGILADRQSQLAYRAPVIFLRHVGTSQAGMALLPFGMFRVEFAQFVHGGVEVVFIAVSVAQVGANGSFLRREALGFAILGKGFLKLVLFVQNQRQVGVGLPEILIEVNGMAVGVDGGGEVSVGRQGNAQGIISVRLLRMPGEPFHLRMHRLAILAVGRQRNTERLGAFG